MHLHSCWIFHCPARVFWGVQTVNLKGTKPQQIPCVFPRKLTARNLKRVASFKEKKEHTSTIYTNFIQFSGSMLVFGSVFKMIFKYHGCVRFDKFHQTTKIAHADVTSSNSSGHPHFHLKGNEGYTPGPELTAETLPSTKFEETPAVSLPGGSRVFLMQRNSLRNHRTKVGPEPDRSKWTI